MFDSCSCYWLVPSALIAIDPAFHFHHSMYCYSYSCEVEIIYSGLFICVQSRPKVSMSGEHKRRIWEIKKLKYRISVFNFPSSSFVFPRERNHPYFPFHLLLYPCAREVEIIPTFKYTFFINFEFTRGRHHEFLFPIPFPHFIFFTLAESRNRPYLAFLDLSLGLLHIDFNLPLLKG